MHAVFTLQNNKALLKKVYSSKDSGEHIISTGYYSQEEVLYMQASVE